MFCISVAGPPVQKMAEKPVIILAENDPGHAGLIINCLQRSGVTLDILHFKDGVETLNFLLKEGDGLHREEGVRYILLLDIRMPMVDGIEVMKRMKRNEEIRDIPIIMVTTTEDPREMEKCRELGCLNYFVKPVNFEKFSRTMDELGRYIQDVVVPGISYS